MHCRTCGTKVQGNAVVCLTCGCPPLVGVEFCRRCGAKCVPGSTDCPECAVVLGRGGSASRLVTGFGDVATNPDPSTKAALPPVAVGLAIFLCFPLGLYLLWRHPTLGRNKAWWWASGIWTLLVVLSAMNGEKGKTPGPSDVASQTPPRNEHPGEISSQSQAIVPTSEVEAGDESVHAHTHGQASTARHNRGIFSNSWDYPNGSQVIYERSVTRSDAKKLGDYLDSQGMFDGDSKTFKIARPGKTYELRVLIKKGLEQDAEAIEGMKLMGAALSHDAFDDAPLDVHLCDENFETIRVVVP